MRMDAATVTIVGRAVTAPTRSTTAAGDRVSFRVVSTERRYDQESKEWVNGDEFGVGVVCWRHLAGKVVDTIRVGDPIVVIGRISTRKYDRNGATEYFTDVRADLVAVDVARMGNRLVRGPSTGEPAAAPDSADDGRAPGPEGAERPAGSSGASGRGNGHGNDEDGDPTARPGGSFDLPWESRAAEPIGGQ